MARSKIISEFLDSITPEKKEKWRQERINRKNELTSDYQFGFYVGQEIVNKHLPTLSTDMLQSRRVIEVSKEDSIENKRLNDEWFETTQYGKNKEEGSDNGNKEKWDLLFNHNKMLEKKYLPNPLKCHIGILNIQNVDEFKRGLRCSLWDCDMCSYDIEPENIKIYDDEECYFTIIEFSLR